MDDNELFPLEAVPQRVGRAILRQFEGRCPNIREVEHISDEQWLAAPGVGPTVLEFIRHVTKGQQQRTDTPSSVGMTDAELLERLEFIQDELRSICRLLKAKPVRPEPPQSVPTTSPPHPGCGVRPTG
ncbi:hypothetical protein AA309_27385 [Microvirga vignae]|uniref:Uncharacterized protein n=1 Tax=Microvirga vignae TaxID=1225564 RepID=A0A0H1R5N6_9HYPH|nr:hypothetical protein AA309_27385 [Microvirga vignae]